MAGSKANTKAAKAVMEPLQRIELGGGLELWQVPIDMPKEQALNARVMTPEAFKQLADNIKRDQRLESLPLCALTEQGLEIISGHHRIRASKRAELTVIWVLVDVTGLPRDKIRSKQLSHNSLQGQDDSDLVKQIFDQIEDAEQRIAAYIQAEKDINKTPIKLTTADLEVEFDTKVATLVFLPAQFKQVEKALKTLAQLEQTDEVFLATREEYETVMQVVDVAADAFNIHSVPTLFAKMAEIVLKHCQSLKDAEHGDD